MSYEEQLKFCEDCPASQGMNEITVSFTKNEGPKPGQTVSGNLPPEKRIYAHDPENPEAGAIILGEDNSCANIFGPISEMPRSIALADTKRKTEACEGPKTTTSWFGLKKSIVCGVGFKDDSKFVKYLNRSRKNNRG